MTANSGQEAAACTLNTLQDNIQLDYELLIHI